MPIVHMARGAVAHPGRQFRGGLAVMHAPADIADLLSNALPFRAVRGTVACHRMGDLVQQHLVNLVVIEALSKQTRDGDPLPRVVALPGAGPSPIEPEGPFAWIQVHPDQ